jgi:lipopolysaccharide transport system ATP-binding protein
VLFVSHNLAAVQSLCRTGALLEGGRLMERGPITQILDAYQRALLEGPPGTHAEVGAVPEDGVRVVGWELRGAATGDLHSCFSRETVRFVFKVLSRTTAEEVNVSVILQNAQGEIVFGATSLEQKPPHFSLRPGNHEVSMTVAVPLQPGVYHLGISLNHRERGQLERAHPVPALSILPHGPTRMAQKYQGILNMPATFDYPAKAE